MQYHSTRNINMRTTGAGAIAAGQAPDGGLFVPEKLPRLSEADILSLREKDYIDRAVFIMSKFLDDYNVTELEAFARVAYGGGFDGGNPAPLRFLDDKTAVLELWHGKTCAFKDMALQMLPHLLTAALKKTGDKRSVCVLVATSGDTGKAALEGFKDVPGTKIAVFYPLAGVSAVQKAQMVTQVGENVFVSAVSGNFDDAQAGVKSIFSDTDFALDLSARGVFLSSANSINWGRLLPQIVYYVSAYCDFVGSGKAQMGESVDFCVPTGNFGNILAGWYAKKMGLPVHKFICASNENNVLTDFINTGVYDKNRGFFVTASPSMDILVSSNLERLLFALCRDGARVDSYMRALSQTGRYEITPEMKQALCEDFSAGFCDDARTKTQLKKIFEKNAYLMDTHTAVASQVLDTLRKNTGEHRKTVIVSTASPYKFAPDVLAALSGAEVSDGGGMSELFALTGERIPEPLERVAGEVIRFSGCVERQAMKDAVRTFLTR